MLLRLILSLCLLLSPQFEDAVDDVRYGLLEVRQIDALTPLVDVAAPWAEIKGGDTEAGGAFKRDIIERRRQSQIVRQRPLCSRVCAAQVAGVADAGKIWDDR